MADVLLTHSYHLPYDPKQVRKMQPYPPLGTLYAASALQASDISVAVFDTMLEDPDSNFARVLLEHDPKVVVIYEDDFNFLSKMCLTRMRKLAWELTDKAKQSGAVVIAHGSDMTDQAESYLRNQVDFILLGEAEETLVALCSAILRGQPPSDIPGLAYLDAGGTLVTNAGDIPRNPLWSSLPGPSRELIDLAPYRRAWSSAHGRFSTNIVASRGCPYRCNWCAKPISGNKFQIRSARAVAAEIRELKEVYDVEHIWFGDDVFALNHQWVQDFADEIERNKCGLPFKIQSRADLMTPKTIRGLKRAGCTEVWMGIESGSQRILDAMDKGLRVDDAITARALLANEGIRACFFLQLGYPGETWQDIQQTVELVRTTRPDEIGISFSYPLPGTKFYEQVQQQIGAKQNWTDSDDLCVMFCATYGTAFYKALRNALHAEVNSWKKVDVPGSQIALTLLWQRVIALEAISRNSGATGFPPYATPRTPASPKFIPVETLIVAGGRL